MRSGQHFLVDPAVIERIAGYAMLSPKDSVLEIGPGTGNLTLALSARAGRVYAVEVDPELAGGLAGRFPNVEMISGDALRVELPNTGKVVSNLPYQISSRILLRLLPRKFELMVLMFQLEFAKRLLAGPGSKRYGRLAVHAAHFSSATLLETVPRTAFSPQPRITSAVMLFRPRTNRVMVDDGTFNRVTGHLFSGRRKKVKNSLLAGRVNPMVVASLDREVQDARPEDLTADQIARIALRVAEERSL